jgi:hypothetical protein
MAEKDPAKRKHRCHLRHQKDEGKLIKTIDKKRRLYMFRRYHCVFCGAWVGDDLIEKP